MLKFGVNLTEFKLQCEKSIASASLFSVYKNMLKLDVGMTKLVELDVHGLLRTCDIQQIFTKNVRLRTVRVTNFDWNNHDTLDITGLAYLKEFRVFTNDRDLRVKMCRVGNGQLEQLELTSLLCIDEPLVDEVCALAKGLQEVTLHLSGSGQYVRA